jgi:hypothetical protein
MTAATGMAEDTRASTVKLALLEAEVNRGGTLRVRELLRAVLELVDMLDGGPEFADGLQTVRDVPFFPARFAKRTTGFEPATLSLGS